MRPGLVIRSRLFELLDHGALGTVTLISAPPGSGKTTLVQSWLAAREPTAAWVYIRRDETDETHFWGQVLDAVRDSGVVRADSGLATLVPSPHAAAGRAGRPPARRAESGVSTVPLTLVRRRRSPPAARPERCSVGLETLLAAAPPMLRFCLLTRRDPKIGLHRLRLSGRLTEIRAANLEFTAEEAG